MAMSVAPTKIFASFLWKRGRDREREKDREIKTESEAQIYIYMYREREKFNHYVLHETPY
jgi:hypothetical protein